MKYRTILCSLLAAAPVLLFARSQGPPVRRTATPVDGGLDCTVCHRTYAPANSDGRGSVSLDINSYTPGVPTLVHVTVNHPDSARWGFQLTARLASNLKAQAGTFLANDTVRVRCDVDGNPDSAPDGPCNGIIEFVEHRNAPRGSLGAGFTFEFQWTPPATDVGDVEFYVAGNAANGDGNLTGDKIYTIRKTVSPACSLSVKPSIRSVVNAASGLPPFSGNALLSIFGSGFQPTGRTRSVTDADIQGIHFPTTMSCVAVEIAGQRVPLLYAQQDQLNVQAPTLTQPSGPLQVVVVLNPGTKNELRSDPATATGLQAWAPALFTFNGTSVAALFAGTSKIVASPSVVAGATPAKPGDTISVFGTGFGYTNPAWQAGEIPFKLSPLPALYNVNIGGVDLDPPDIPYAGASPGTIGGVMQFNLKIPATAPDGDVLITITMGGQTTPSGLTVPVKR